ncbi:MAG TPA: hypothetical protein VGI58_16915 [Streptosporangiaceae bacterium]|jgi:hypothetical protein
MTIGAGRGPDEHEEIVEFGADRAAHRHRWLTPLILTALLLATVGILVGRSGAHHSPPHRPAAQPPRLRRTITHLGSDMLGITAAWDIFARGPDDLVEIQPARGLITTTAVPSLGTGLPQVSFIVGPNQVLVRSPDEVPGYLIPDGAAPRLQTGPFSHGGPVVPGPDPEHVWVMGGAIGTPKLELVGLDGQAAGRDILLRPGQDGATAVPDGRGDVLLLSEDNRIYNVGPGFSRPVADQVVAVGPTDWLAVSCHGQRCRNLVIDPATGASRPLAGPSAAPEAYWAWPPPGAVSPDGSTAAVLAESATPGVWLINMRSGASRTLPVPMANSPANELMAWSPDSRWLFLAASNGRLLALNARTGSLRTLGVRLPDITQVVIRPAAGA